MKRPSLTAIVCLSALVALLRANAAHGEILTDENRFQITIPEAGATACVAIPQERSSPKHCDWLDLPAARAANQASGDAGETIGLIYLNHPDWAATVVLRRLNKPGVEFEEEALQKIAEVNALMMHRRDDISLRANKNVSAELRRVHGVQVYRQSFDVLPGKQLQLEVEPPPQRWIMHYIPAHDAMYSLTFISGDFDADKIGPLAEQAIETVRATPARRVAVTAAPAAPAKSRSEPPQAAAPPAQTVPTELLFVSALVGLTALSFWRRQHRAALRH